MANSAASQKSPRLALYAGYSGETRHLASSFAYSE
jgi:hypothetical protein